MQDEVEMFSNNDEEFNLDTVLQDINFDVIPSRKRRRNVEIDLLESLPCREGPISSRTRAGKRRRNPECSSNTEQVNEFCLLFFKILIKSLFFLIEFRMD